MTRTIKKVFFFALVIVSACDPGQQKGAQNNKDCSGIVDGEAYLDACGECVGGSTGRKPCKIDCNGIAGGQAHKDYCGHCVGGSTGSQPCHKDCDGIFGGLAHIDECGDCVGGQTGKSPCEQDCSGLTSGDAYLDPCGRCVGGDTGLSPCEKDCNGELEGAAYWDNCGHCVEGRTGRAPCVTDCSGVEDGEAHLDPCGNCVGGNTGRQKCEKDCNGVFGGLAFLDSCGNCVGGNTETPPCESACALDFGDDSYLDECGICVGGTSGRLPCEEDCSGLLGGKAFVDQCGACVGGNTESEPCGKDCNGDEGGTAYTDGCNICVGGGTGRTACPSLALGEKHTCVLKSGDLYCWGRRVAFSAKDSTRLDSNLPTRIGSNKWQSIWASAYYDSMYGIHDDERLYYFWFVNSAIDPTPLDTGTWKSATVGGPPQKKNYGIRGDDKLFSLSGGLMEQTSQEYWGAVSAGLEHVCAISSGTSDLYCWGRNWEGQLGLNDRNERNMPVFVGTDWKALSAGSSHTCGIKMDGHLYCFGSNSFGQLGNGDFDTKKVLSPQRVNSDDTKWKSVSAGMYHTCGIQQNDKLYCWGSNYHGQLGDETRAGKDSPVPVGDENWKWRSVDAGGYHTCAMRQNDKLYCWGWNKNGQLGNGSNEEQISPTLVEFVPLDGSRS